MGTDFPFCEMESSRNVARDTTHTVAATIRVAMVKTADSLRGVFYHNKKSRRLFQGRNMLVVVNKTDMVWNAAGWRERETDHKMPSLLITIPARTDRV